MLESPTRKTFSLPVIVILPSVISTVKPFASSPLLTVPSVFVVEKVIVETVPFDETVNFHGSALILPIVVFSSAVLVVETVDVSVCVTVDVVTTVFVVVIVSVLSLVTVLVV